ncbi:VirB4 family type IV secretion system protein [Natrononativus amylolyticus]|uniref:VirB4 family type IV secretion system protein n=1 Tax=Natrononativus amylolyticus TaxID=2963434 RepID=UPI0020CE42A0|nr:conjugal transfer protein [Natrononativus amylolyticus]
MSNASTDDSNGTDFKVFGGVSGDQVILGVSKLEIGAALLPTAVIWFVARQAVPPGTRLPFYLLAFAWAVIGLGFISAKEPWQSALEYTETIVRFTTQQEIMLYDRHPERSGIEQPTSDSLFGRLATLPGLEGIPFIGGSGSPEEKAVDRPLRSQDIVQFERAYSGTPALETDSGTVVGAIAVSPANMVTASDNDWKRQSELYAKVLNTALSGSIQISEYMRMVDYTPRIEHYRQRHETIVTTGDGMAPPGEISYENLPFGMQVHADLCQERANVVSTYDLSTLVVDPYVIAEVKPSDVVSSDDVDGGLTSIPLIGRLYTNFKIHQLRKSGEHVPEMIDLLEERLETLTEAIRRLDGVKANGIPSERLAQVAADHYQSANVYAHADYTSLVRQNPVPVPKAATGSTLDSPSDADYASDPEYELTYAHLDAEAERNPTATLTKSHSRLATAEKHAEFAASNCTRGKRTSERLSETAESAETTAQTSENAPDCDEILTRKGTSWGGGFPANSPGVADIATTDEELDDQFRSLLAPESFERSNSSYVTIDGKLHSATMFISSWPKDPPQGILETVLQFDDAEIATNVSTHIDVLDQAKAERELADLEDALEDKAERVENSKLSMFGERYRENQQEAKSMLQSFLASGHDMFEAQTYIEVQSRNPAAIERAVRSIRSKLADVGAEITVLHRNHDRGHQTVAPACQDKIGQKVRMRADGLATTNAWTTKNLYDPTGIEIGENMATNEPLSVDIYKRDAGYNWMIVGKTGAGKTVTSSEVLWRQKTNNPEMFMAVIDPLQEFANLREIFDGERIVVGSTHLNPFDISPTPEDKLEVIGWDAPYTGWLDSNLDFLELYYNIQKFDFSTKRAVWSQGIRIAGERKGIEKNPKTHDPEYRRQNGYDGDPPTVLDVVDVIKEMAHDAGPFVDDMSNEAMVAEREEKAINIINNQVEPFKEGGHLEHLAHQTEVDLSDTDFVWADLQLKEGDEEGGGLMMHLLLDLLYNEIKSRPERGMIFCDEFHYLLRDDMTVKSLSQKYRHHRHWDLSIGAGTQSHKDFFGTDGEGNVHMTDNAETMFELSSMEIYQFVEGMNAKWAEKLGLSGQEGEIISGLQKGNQVDGFSEALLRIDDEGCFPVRVRMDREMNPRESIALMYDPSTHGENYREYLLKHDDVCEWRWS